VLHVTKEGRVPVLAELTAAPGKTIVFTRTKHGAKALARQLNSRGVPAVELHGNLAQNARTRNLAAFGDGTATTLVATDIAARGIHVDDVGLVVHADPPVEHKAYLHRSGRTARAGAEGVVVTVGTPSQAGDVRTLMRQAAIKPQTHSVVPGHPVIGEVTGPTAAYVTPTYTPTPEVDSRGGGRRGGGGRSGGGRSGGGRPQSGSGRPQGNGSRPNANAGRPQSSSQGQRSGSRSTSGAQPAGANRGVAAFSSSRRRGGR